MLVAALVTTMGYQARPSNFSTPRRLQDARSYQFVQDLEQCIRETATEVALQYPSWGDNCMPGTYIVDAQAAVYSKTLSPIMEKHGYTGALWCAFFSIRMFHDPDPNDPQPNQPFYKLWYESLVCPWDLGVCGDEPLGQSGYEGDGVPTEWAGDRQHPQYIGEDRRAMSCGLCGHLRNVFGKPPYHVADTVPDSLPQGIWEFADGGHMVRPSRGDALSLDGTTADLSRIGHAHAVAPLPHTHHTNRTPRVPARRTSTRLARGSPTTTGCTAATSRRRCATSTRTRRATARRSTASRGSTCASSRVRRSQPL